MQTFVIPGTHSGFGKTTLTHGLLAVLHKRSQQVQGFKVGPDQLSTPPSPVRPRST